MSEIQRKTDQLFKEILSEVAVLKDEKTFREIHGFSPSEYIRNREKFAKTCRDHADHIEKVVFDTGIAKTTGGGVAIASGAATIGGIILAPFTAGLSLGLTIGGIAGGVASAATTITAEIVKDKNLSHDKEEIEKALKMFQGQEEKIGRIFKSIQDNLKKLREMMKDPNVAQYIEQIVKGTKKVVYNIVYKGYVTLQSVNAARFAKNVADFIQADFYAVTGFAKGMASPGLRIFGKTLITAGGTTAKMLSGSMAVLGLGFGIWDVVEGTKDINGSEVAQAYRKFAQDYEKQTQEIQNGIQQLTKL